MQIQSEIIYLVPIMAHSYLLRWNFVLSLIRTEPKADCVFVVACVMYV